MARCLVSIASRCCCPESKRVSLHRPCARTGTFGRVLECWDRDTKSKVAIKVIRNVPKYHEAALIEVRAVQASSVISSPGAAAVDLTCIARNIAQVAHGRQPPSCATCI